MHAVDWHYSKGWDITMQRSKLLLIVFLVCISVPVPSYAYLDPGTGSMLLQALLAGILVATAYMSFAWSKVKLFFADFWAKLTGAARDEDHGEEQKDHSEEQR